jgi:phasin family protein
MFTASPEQIDAVKTNTDAFMTLSKIAFSSAERLAALNLKVARAALKDSFAATSTMLQAKDIKELQGLQTSTPGATTENAVAYFRDVQEIAAETQKEVTKLMTSYTAQISEGSKANASWGKGFEMFKQVTSQITAVTDANIKAVGDATAQMAGSVAAHSKKVA